MKNQTSIVNFEKGTKGILVTGYTFEGGFTKTFINGRLMRVSGTPSSNGKKPFSKTPSHFLVD